MFDGTEVWGNAGERGGPWAKWTPNEAARLGSLPPRAHRCVTECHYCTHRSFQAVSNMRSAAYATLTASIVYARRVRTSAFVDRRRRTLPKSQVWAAQPRREKGADWFSDGRRAAIDLKRELGLLDDDDGPMPSRDGTDRMNEEVPANEIEDAIETGKAAARALLAQTNGGGDGRGDGEGAPDDGRIQKVTFQKDKRASDAPRNPLEDDVGDVFDLPARKSHSLTVCMVPPSSAAAAWARLTAARRRCRDPGFFRWPPHANIVYPFLEPVLEEDGIMTEEDQRASFEREVARHLALAAERVEPFDVTVDSFGIFGGKSRGVMWAYPRSERAGGAAGEEPLMTLQEELERQFPMCRDQRKNGKFSPRELFDKAILYIYPRQSSDIRGVYIFQT